MTDKRTKRVEIRLTDNEYQALLDRKSKPRLAEWIRDITLAQKVKRKATPTDPKLLFELNRIGVNLNQIAKQCHAQQGNIDLVKIGIELQAISSLLQDIRDLSNDS